MKFLYPIKKLNIKTWIKYWLLKKTSGSKVLSELIEGTSPITIENAYKGTILQELAFKGQASQTGTPTPEAPVPVQVVKGNNTITINDTDYQINLNDYELCKIGDYQDRIYKSNGTWYLHKEIGKVVLNGSENWGSFIPVSGSSTISQIRLFMNFRSREGYSDLFRIEPNYNATEHIVIGGGLNAIFFQILNERLNTVDLAGFKTWLSTHNTTVYYISGESTTTEITDTNLIEQLEAIKNATLISGTNEITQLPADLPFILNFKYYMKG